MKRTEYVLSKLPDCDDALRRLANVLMVPQTCRKRACRDNRCQGGYGPPCYFERREFFAQALLDGMEEYREQWDELRAEVRTSLQRPRKGRSAPE